MKQYSIALTLIGIIAILASVSVGGLIECCASDAACRELEYDEFVGEDRIAFTRYEGTVYCDDEGVNQQLLQWKNYQLSTKRLSWDWAGSCPEDTDGPDWGPGYSEPGKLRNNIAFGSEDIGAIDYNSKHHKPLLMRVVREYVHFADACMGSGMAAIAQGDANFESLIWSDEVMEAYVTGVNHLATYGAPIFRLTEFDNVQKDIRYPVLFVRGEDPLGLNAAHAARTGRVVVISHTGLDFLTLHSDRFLANSDVYPVHTTGAPLVYLLIHELIHIIGVEGGPEHHEGSSGCTGSGVIGDTPKDRCAFRSFSSILNDAAQVWPSRLCRCCWDKVAWQVQTNSYGGGYKSAM